MFRLEEYQHIINGAQNETARSILELATTAKSLWNQRSPIERRQLLDMLLSNRSLSGSSVEFVLKKPFAVLAEMATNQSWRGLRDDLRNFLMSDRMYSQKALVAKFEELRQHINLSPI